MRSILVGVVMLALCAPLASAASRPPDPCSVVTAAAAAAALKATPAPTKPKTTAGGRTCTYTAKHLSLAVETRSVASVQAFTKSTASLPPPVYPFAGFSNAYSAGGGKEFALWKNGTEVIVTFHGFEPVVQVQATLASAAFAGL